MPLELSLATEDDISLIVPFQYAAFHPVDTIHRLIYPSPLPIPPSTITTTIQRTLKAWRADPSHITWVIVRDTSTSIADIYFDGEEKERIVGAAKWIIFSPSSSSSGPPQSSPSQSAGKTDGEKKQRWPDKITVDWLQKAEGGLVNEGLGAADDKEYVSYVMEEYFARRRERISGGNGEGAVLLDACFVDPGYHRRGIGKMLVGWGTKKADEMGVRAFVESSPRGRRLYEGCGFREVEDIRLVGSEVKEEWRGYEDAVWTFMERDVKA